MNTNVNSQDDMKLHQAWQSRVEAEEARERAEEELLDGPCIVCGEYRGFHTPGCMVGQKQAESDAMRTAREQILSDVRRGIVPTTIERFEDLHTYVDANMYGSDDLEIEQVAALQDQVDAWIKSGGFKAEVAQMQAEGIEYDFETHPTEHLLHDHQIGEREYFAAVERGVTPREGHNSEHEFPRGHTHPGMPVRPQYKISFDSYFSTADGTERIRKSGWLILEAEDDNEAKSYAEWNSDGLLDVDFIEPGDHFPSAANKHVIDGHGTLPLDGEEFYQAVITKVERFVPATTEALQIGPVYA